MDSSDANSTRKREIDHALGNGDEEKSTSGPVGEVDDLTALGYKPELQRNRSMFTLLFQSLAIAAVGALSCKGL